MEVREAAAAALTEKQLHVWRLSLQGVSQERMAWMFSISRSTVRWHLSEAWLKLERVGVRLDSGGMISVVEVTELKRSAGAC